MFSIYAYCYVCINMYGRPTIDVYDGYVSILICYMTVTVTM